MFNDITHDWLAIKQWCSIPKASASKLVIQRDTAKPVKSAATIVERQTLLRERTGSVLRKRSEVDGSVIPDKD